MRFRTDLAELSEVIRRLEAAHAGLEALADQLRGGGVELHAHWDGEAATAHVAAQAQWDDGFATMRAALAAMKSAADAARDHYSMAADTNVTMWRQLG